ncbi:MAG TPA: hypothetical protein PLS73_10705 [Saprospiraceae bacterium]|nr:hypothetical protein [Saprospiraceae bacterium]
MSATREIFSSRLQADPVQLQVLIEDLINFSSPQLMADDLEDLFFIAMASSEIENMTTDNRGILILSYRKVYDFLRELQKLCVVMDGTNQPNPNPVSHPEGEGC